MEYRQPPAETVAAPSPALAETTTMFRIHTFMNDLTNGAGDVQAKAVELHQRLQDLRELHRADPAPYLVLSPSLAAAG